MAASYFPQSLPHFLQKVFNLYSLFLPGMSICWETCDYGVTGVE